MAITLGSIAFAESHTAVHEKYEEVGGKDGRIVTLSGLIVGEETLAAVEARLDAILGAASDHDYGVALSIRPGRRLWVRRAAFSRDVNRARTTGSFELRLEARDPSEESIDLHTLEWPIAANGATIEVATAGNAPAPLRIALVALGSLIGPSLGDGPRTMAFEGIVSPGQTLILDGPSGRATLDGEDVTPYTFGEWPRADPAGTVLTFRDEDWSSHAAHAVVSYRDRWW